MTTFTVYRELQSALSVDLCLHGRFTAPDASNLLLFRGQVLEIYDVGEGKRAFSWSPLPKSLGPGSAWCARASPRSSFSRQPRCCPVERQGPKLALRERHRLFGCVSSAQLLQLPGSGRDALVLGFPDAKLSVVEYDPAQVRACVPYHLLEAPRRSCVVRFRDRRGSVPCGLSPLMTSAKLPRRGLRASFGLWCALTLRVAAPPWFTSTRISSSSPSVDAANAQSCAALVMRRTSSPPNNSCPRSSSP